MASTVNCQKVQQRPVISRSKRIRFINLAQGPNRWQRAIAKVCGHPRASTNRFQLEYTMGGTVLLQECGAWETSRELLCAVVLLVIHPTRLQWAELAS
jgi:hypothetical protein